jgi:uncharacterized protein YceK
LQTYSCSLEATAQAWANNCNFVHSHGPYGENLYIATGAPTTNPLIDAGDDWWSEAAMTGLDDPTTAIFDTSDTASGHFTQVESIIFERNQSNYCRWHGA